MRIHNLPHYREKEDYLINKTIVNVLNVVQRKGASPRCFEKSGMIN